MKNIYSVDQARSHFLKSKEPVKAHWKESVKQIVGGVAEAMAFYSYMEAGPKASDERLEIFQCKLCLDELPKGTSPKDYARVQVGFTPHGIQVWCNRHDCNVIHINFEGVKHPANFDRLPTDRN